MSLFNYLFFVFAPVIFSSYGMIEETIITDPNIFSALKYNNPSHTMQHFNIQQRLQNPLQSEREKAEEELKTLAVATKHSPMNYHVGWLYQQKDNYVEAARWYKRSGKNPLAQEQRASLLNKNIITKMTDSERELLYVKLLKESAGPHHVFFPDYMNYGSQQLQFYNISAIKKLVHYYGSHNTTKANKENYVAYTKKLASLEPYNMPYKFMVAEGLYDLGNEIDALKELGQLVYENYSPAQHLLGLFYWYGRAGLAQNKQKGLELIEKAANNHYDQALVDLGRVRMKQDKKDEAISLWVTAFEQPSVLLWTANPVKEEVKELLEWQAMEGNQEAFRCLWNWYQKQLNSYSTCELLTSPEYISLRSLLKTSVENKSMVFAQELTCKLIEYLFDACQKDRNNVLQNELIECFANISDVQKAVESLKILKSTDEQDVAFAHDVLISIAPFQESARQLLFALNDANDFTWLKAVWKNCTQKEKEKDIEYIVNNCANDKTLMHCAEYLLQQKNSTHLKQAFSCLGKVSPSADIVSIFAIMNARLNQKEAGIIFAQNLIPVLKELALTKPILKTEIQELEQKCYSIILKSKPALFKQIIKNQPQVILSTLSAETKNREMVVQLLPLLNECANNTDEKKALEKICEQLAFKYPDDKKIILDLFAIIHKNSFTNSAFVEVHKKAAELGNIHALYKVGPSINQQLEKEEQDHQKAAFYSSVLTKMYKTKVDEEVEKKCLSQLDSLTNSHCAFTVYYFLPLLAAGNKKAVEERGEKLFTYALANWQNMGVVSKHIQKSALLNKFQGNKNQAIQDLFNVLRLVQELGLNEGKIDTNKLVDIASYCESLEKSRILDCVKPVLAQAEHIVGVVFAELNALKEAKEWYEKARNNGFQDKKYVLEIVCRDLYEAAKKKNPHDDELVKKTFADCQKAKKNILAHLDEPNAVFVARSFLVEESALFTAEEREQIFSALKKLAVNGSSLAYYCLEYAQQSLPTREEIKKANLDEKTLNFSLGLRAYYANMPIESGDYFGKNIQYNDIKSDFLYHVLTLKNDDINLNFSDKAFSALNKLLRQKAFCDIWDEEKKLLYKILEATLFQKAEQNTKFITKAFSFAADVYPPNSVDRIEMLLSLTKFALRNKEITEQIYSLSDILPKEESGFIKAFLDESAISQKNYVPNSDEWKKDHEIMLKNISDYEKNEINLSSQLCKISLSNIYLRLAKFCQQEKKFDKARDYYDKTLTMNPKKECVNEYLIAEKLTKKSSTKNIITKLESLMQSGNIDAGEILFLMLKLGDLYDGIIKCEHNEEHAYRIVKSLYEMGDPKAAVQIVQLYSLESDYYLKRIFEGFNIDTVLEKLKPHNYSEMPLFELMVSYAKQKNMYKKDYNSILEMCNNPHLAHNTGALLYKTKILIELKKYPEALDCIEQIYKLGLDAKDTLISKIVWFFRLDDLVKEMRNNNNADYVDYWSSRIKWSMLHDMAMIDTKKQILAALRVSDRKNCELWYKIDQTKNQSFKAKVLTFDLHSMLDCLFLGIGSTKDIIDNLLDKTIELIKISPVENGKFAYQDTQDLIPKIHKYLGMHKQFTEDQSQKLFTFLWTMTEHHVKFPTMAINGIVMMGHYE